MMTSGFINQWAFEGMTGEKGVIDCAVVQGRSGAEVLYGIEVKNLNDEPVTVIITDPKLGLNQTETIAANTTFQLEDRSDADRSRRQQRVCQCRQRERPDSPLATPAMPARRPR